jgi:hypothetical protein
MSLLAPGSRLSIADYLHAQPEPALRILGDWCEEHAVAEAVRQAQLWLDLEIGVAAEEAVKLQGNWRNPNYKWATTFEQRKRQFAEMIIRMLSSSTWVHKDNSLSGWAARIVKRGIDEQIIPELETAFARR